MRIIITYDLKDAHEGDYKKAERNLRDTYANVKKKTETCFFLTSSTAVDTIRDRFRNYNTKTSAVAVVSIDDWATWGQQEKEN